MNAHAWMVVVAVLVIAACGGATDPTPSDSLRCEHAIDHATELPEHLSSSPHPDIGFLVGDVHPLARRGPDNDPEAPLQFAKIPIAVRNGAAVTLAVADGAALMGWGERNASEPGTDVAVTACEAPGWTVFAGGLWVVEPRCVTVAVTGADGAEATIDLGVGGPC